MSIYGSMQCVFALDHSVSFDNGRLPRILTPAPVSEFSRRKSLFSTLFPPEISRYKIRSGSTRVLVKRK